MESEVHGLLVGPDDLELIYDALRFARDEFADENGLRWSNDEYASLQGIIERLEALLPTSESD
jgi:hypothetical protein